MEIFDNLDRIRRDSNNVITVGTFDGLHLGHQYIFNELKQTATQVEGIPTVVTFNPHPQIVLAAPDKPPIKILTTIEQKIELIRRQDIQKLIIIPFTLEFSRLSSEEYVNRILYETIGLKGIVIGYDHAFGKGREGGIHTLTQIGQEKHFFIKKLSPFMLDGQVISSSLIRQLISRGEVEQANRFLGHP
ncbi:MAG: riboflavin biosynthesis protein RibF, partial [Calditrichaeota bacterium]